MTKSVRSKTTAFPQFMSLPPEVRIQIYNLLEPANRLIPVFISHNTYWLPNTLQPPVTFSLCRESRYMTIRRYQTIKKPNFFGDEPDIILYIHPTDTILLLLPHPRIPRPSLRHPEPSFRGAMNRLYFGIPRSFLTKLNIQHLAFLDRYGSWMVRSQLTLHDPVSGSASDVDVAVLNSSIEQWRLIGKGEKGEGIQRVQEMKVVEYGKKEGGKRRLENVEHEVGMMKKRDRTRCAHLGRERQKWVGVNFWAGKVVFSDEQKYRQYRVLAVE